MLFNEPKLLKSSALVENRFLLKSFSALQRAEIAEIRYGQSRKRIWIIVSVLFNEPKLLKFAPIRRWAAPIRVSVLFNEPKLLK